MQQTYLKQTLGRYKQSGFGPRTLNSWEGKSIWKRNKFFVNLDETPNRAVLTGISQQRAREMAMKSIQHSRTEHSRAQFQRVDEAPRIRLPRRNRTTATPSIRCAQRRLVLRMLTATSFSILPEGIGSENPVTAQLR